MLNAQDPANRKTTSAMGYEGNHPTEDRTTAIIEALQTTVEKNIIFDEAEGNVTYRWWYTEVQPTYNVGYRGCDMSEYTSHLSGQCLETAVTINTDEFDSII